MPPRELRKSTLMAAICSLINWLYDSARASQRLSIREMMKIIPFHNPSYRAAPARARNVISHHGNRIKT